MSARYAALGSLIFLAGSASYADDPIVLASPRPPRPPRPPASQLLADSERPNYTEIQEILQKMREQQRVLRAQQKATADELRAQARQQVKTTLTSVPALRQDARQSLEEAKVKAREQARKLAEEAKDILRTARAPRE